MAGNPRIILSSDDIRPNIHMANATEAAEILPCHVVKTGYQVNSYAAASYFGSPVNAASFSANSALRSP